LFSNGSAPVVAPEKFAMHLSNSAALPATADETGRFRVVLLYDRLVSAGRAMATYGPLVRALDDDFKPDLRIWRMETAASPEFAAKAAEDLSAAELIVVAVGTDEPCPSAIRRWLDGVAAGIGRQPHGILALVGTPEESEAGDVTWGQVLGAVATQIHPGVFVFQPAEGMPEPAGVPSAAT
jgi:hypothetical protein